MRTCTSHKTPDCTPCSELERQLGQTRDLLALLVPEHVRGLCAATYSPLLARALVSHASHLPTTLSRMILQYASDCAPMETRFCTVGDRKSVAQWLGARLEVEPEGGIWLPLYSNGEALVTERVRPCLLLRGVGVERNDDSPTVITLTLPMSRVHRRHLWSIYLHLDDLNPFRSNCPLHNPFGERDTTCFVIRASASLDVQRIHVSTEQLYQAKLELAAFKQIHSMGWHYIVMTMNVLELTLPF